MSSEIRLVSLEDERAAYIRGEKYDASQDIDKEEGEISDNDCEAEDRRVQQLASLRAAALKKVKSRPKANAEAAENFLSSLELEGDFEFAQRSIETVTEIEFASCSGDTTEPMEPGYGPDLIEQFGHVSSKLLNDSCLTDEVIASESALKLPAQSYDEVDATSASTTTEKRRAHRDAEILRLKEREAALKVTGVEVFSYFRVIFFSAL